MWRFSRLERHPFSWTSTCFQKAWARATWLRVVGPQISGRTEVSKSIKVAWKTGMQTCDSPTSQPRIFLQKDAVLSSWNFATTHLTAVILHFYLPVSFVTHDSFIYGQWSPYWGSESASLRRSHSLVRMYSPGEPLSASVATRHTFRTQAQFVRIILEPIKKGICLRTSSVRKSIRANQNSSCLRILPKGGGFDPGLFQSFIWFSWFRWFLWFSWFPRKTGTVVFWTVVVSIFHLVVLVVSMIPVVFKHSESHCAINRSSTSFTGGKSTWNNPPQKKFTWTSFSEQFSLGSWLVSQGRRQKFAQTFRKSSGKRYFGYLGMLVGFWGLYS